MERAGLSQKNDERELFRLYIEGDEEAFRKFYARVSPKVWSFVKRRISDSSIAEEVFQEAWLKIHRSREQYDPKFHPLAWIYTITRSVWMDRMRRLGARPEIPTDPLEWENVAPAMTSLNHSEREDSDVERFLSELPSDQRELLEQRYEQELSFEEMARAAGVREETIRKRLSRLLQKLRRRV